MAIADHLDGALIRHPDIAPRLLRVAANAAASADNAAALTELGRAIRDAIQNVPAGDRPADTAAALAALATLAH